MRSTIPLALSQLDTVTEDEYSDALMSDRVAPFLVGLDDETIHRISLLDNSQIERCRPAHSEGARSLLRSRPWSSSHTTQVELLCVCERAEAVDALTALTVNGGRFPS